MSVGIPFMKLVIWHQMQIRIANHLPSLYGNELLTRWKEELLLLCKSAANCVQEGASCTPGGGISSVRSIFYLRCQQYARLRAHIYSIFTSKLAYIVPIVSCNQHERQTTTSNTAPASIIKPYFDITPPPTTYKLMCQLKKSNIFGTLVQKGISSPTVCSCSDLIYYK